MSLPDFNPEATGRAEYEFWRAHHEKDVPRLQAALESWTGQLYGLDSESAAEAVTFLLEATQHHDARDWPQAVHSAERYYRVIQDQTDLAFSPKRAGSLEVAWWRVHDDLEHTADKEPLVKAFQDLYAEVFGISVADALPAAEAHVEATREHDRAEAADITAAGAARHWDAAEAALKRSYELLATARTA